ncbi:QRFP-like peptide receptor [Actinia tenebrosa]|uniref:QRFP-like peptide receptor n=1 Tax=Actinia tenebrosa TaxID=6105 RepID=A0A6P8IXT2_ACTTE|nr:QRFP-like peptide receptor [Actinia tenebrosa]
MCSVFANNTNETCLRNESIVSAPQCISLVKTYEGLKVVLLFFYIVVMVLAILGNTLVIYIVYSNKPMRTSTNIFIVNMAFCDLGIPFFVLPKRMSELFVGKYVWLIPGDVGLALCKLLPFVHDVFIVCSVFSLLLITFDRFCAVLLPHKRHLLSKKVVLISITFAWVLSIGICAIILKAFLVYDVNGKRLCNSFWYTQSYMAYFITMICFNIFIPIVLVTIAYSAIFYKLKHHVLTIGDSFSNRQRQQEHLRQKKIIKMAFAIVCAFAVCWLPYAVVVFIRISFIFSSPSPFASCSFWIASSISYYFMILISVTNPAICFTFGTSFREELCKIIRRVFGCCFTRRVEVVDMAMSEVRL